MSEAQWERLISLAGIEPEYWDLNGRCHKTSIEVERQLLVAMGLNISSDAEIANSIRSLSERSWRGRVRATVVAREGASCSVVYRPSHMPADRILAWTIFAENGIQIPGMSTLEDDFHGHDALQVDPEFRSCRFELPALPAGYHWLQIADEDDSRSRLIVFPDRCFLPSQGGRRCWGLSTQLYSVRSERNLGIGDFGDLARLVDWASRHKGDFIALNPLHAQFPRMPELASPYYPSSRIFHNPLYLDVTSVPEFVECSEARRLSEALMQPISHMRSEEFINYSEVSSAKLNVLQMLFCHFRAHHTHGGDARGGDFARFVERGGVSLRKFAIFQTLSEKLRSHAWQCWPPSLRHANDINVEALAPMESERCLFFEYLQWLCDGQLADVARQARDVGMEFGLCRDLAVGVGGGSADQWMDPEAFLNDVSIGAPPDPFNEAGQAWGLIPANPHYLQTDGYSKIIGLMRANMRHAGALRIDHIMGWQRLFVIPQGASPAEGAYIRFPLDEMIAIAAIESARQKCVLIGEDLGTVPEGLREKAAAAGILSTRILYFEKYADGFHAPSHFPELAMIAATNHDLATLRGYWDGRDISAKVSVGIIKGKPEEDAARSLRQRDKQNLVNALHKEGLLPDAYSAQEIGAAPWSLELKNAVEIFIARSRSILMAVQLDDLADEVDQVNLPGTIDQYPNWMRRLGRSLEEIVADPQVARTLALIQSARSGQRADQ